MTEAEAEALANAGKHWGYWKQRHRVSTDKLASIAKNETDGDVDFELSLRYELGIETPVNLKMALFHLEKAAEKNIGAAQMRLVTEYRDGGGLVERDPVEWMKRLQGAADMGIFAAFEQLAELKRAGRLARDCSAEELSEIEGLYARAESFYRAGSMYCTSKDAEQCSDEELRKAREWYRKGLNLEGTGGCPKCVEILKSWGELKIAEKPSESKSITHLLIAPFALMIWAIIGTALLGVILSISAVTFPLIIGLSVIAALYKALRR